MSSNLDPVELGLAALLEVRRETLAEQVLVRIDEEMPGLLGDEDRRVAGEAARALIVDFTTALRVGAERVDARSPVQRRRLLPRLPAATRSAIGARWHR